MSDPFATQITSSLTSTKSPLTGVALTGGKTEAQTIDFWNFILGQIADEEVRTETNSKETKGNVTSDKIKGEKADLALLQLALLGQDVDEDLNQKLADLQIERVALKQENRIEQLTKLVNHLTSGLPTPPESGTVQELVQRLNNRLEKLEASLEAFRSGDFGEGGSPFKLLIATGLNPAQLTEITNRIEEVEAKLGRELTVEDLIAGVGNIIPAPGDDEHALSTPDALALLEKQKQNQNIKDEETKIETPETAEEGTDALITQQTKIVTATTDGQTEISHEEFSTPVIAVDPAARKQNNSSPVNFTGSVPVELTPSNDVGGAVLDEQALAQNEEETFLSNAEFKEFFGNNKIKSNANFALTHKATNNNALVHLTNTVQNNASGAIPAPLLSDSFVTPQTSISEALGFDLQTGTPFNQTVQAAHLISSPTVAGQTHATTKTIAAQISKSALNGNTNNITLRLDPPELGRVEVRLEFGKEKSVKAHLIVEKPETLLMLQRDASALEKALQDSGLDTNADSLNYEMAAEDHAFQSGKDNQNQGQDKTGTDLEGDNASLEDEILTNMTWDVDPETGHVHYSILA